MKFAKKTKGKVVDAYQLGAGSLMEIELLETGVIHKRDDGRYELFSMETINGTGEIAQSGDYFKINEVDGKFYAYPNEKGWFESHHKHLQGDTYEQVNAPLLIWQAGDEESEEIRYLLDNKKMTINTEDADRYFNAYLWGADLSAAKDATVIFYEVKRNEEGQIIDISFNFIHKDQFEQDYEICP